MTTHAIGDSQVYHGALDTVSDHQTGLRGFTCHGIFQALDPWLHAGELYVMECGTNDALIMVSPEASAYWVTLMRDAVEAKGGTFLFATPPALHVDNQHAVTVASHSDRMHKWLPSDLEMVDANGIMREEGHDLNAANYQEDLGHVSPQGAEIYGQIVMPELGASPALWLVLVLLGIGRRVLR